MLNALEVGQVISRKGFFTHACYFRGATSAEIEQRVGYRKGRLDGGYGLLFLMNFPSVAGFAFRGYSQMSGGVAEGHRPIPPDARSVERKMLDKGYDMNRLKHKIITETFTLNGWKRLAKIVPRDAPFGRDDFPAGTGVPQWEATSQLNWKVAAVIGPGQKYLGNYI